MDAKPEIIIGLVSGIGSDLNILCESLEQQFKEFKFNTVTISLTHFFNLIKGKDLPEITSGNNVVEEKQKKILFGNFLRRSTKSNSILAAMAVSVINQMRLNNNSDHEGTIYIIKQLKTKEEFHLLRKVYGRSFVLISAFEDEEIRKSNIQAELEKAGNQNAHSDAEKIIDTDKNEKISYGQNVSNLFAEGHLFVNIGDQGALKIQLERFVNILFDYQFHTPSIDESRMFLAKGLAARSGDLSRQVGAVIANDDGDIISAGCNDVPKFGGGFYWEGDTPDLRDFKYGYDINKDIIKSKINESIDEIYQYLQPKEKDNDFDKIIEQEKLSEKYNIDFSKISKEECFKKLNDKNFKAILATMLTKSDLTDALEFSRSIHAEMAAICDASRRGVSVQGSTLYCTTFPCHMCAKHILGVGIKRVVYIDPYPKSKAKKLFKESITLRENNNDKLSFQPFQGIAPRRFIQAFIRSKDDRKDKNDDTVKEWERKLGAFFKNRTPASYYLREIAVIIKLTEIFSLKDDASPHLKDKNEIATSDEDSERKTEKYYQYLKDAMNVKLNNILGNDTQCDLIKSWITNEIELKQSNRQ